MMYGYASSPIAFRELVILPVGGRGRAVMAFNQADGKVVWSKNDFGNVYSSPVLINVGGLEQLALILDGAVVAVNPHNGDLQWRVPFKADFSIAVATPVWGPDNLLFVSSEYNAGTKVIELRREHDDEHDGVSRPARDRHRRGVGPISRRCRRQESRARQHLFEGLPGQRVLRQGAAGVPRPVRETGRQGVGDLPDHAGHRSKSLHSSYSKLQFTDAALPAIYEAEGLRYLAQLSKHDDDFKTFVTRFARRLVDAAENYPLPALPVVASFDTLTNLFAAPSRHHQSGGAANARFVFVAADAGQFVPPRTAVARYGGGGKLERDARWPWPTSPGFSRPPVTASFPSTGISRPQVFTATFTRSCTTRRSWRLTASSILSSTTRWLRWPPPAAASVTGTSRTPTSFAAPRR